MKIRILLPLICLGLVSPVAAHAGSPPGKTAPNEYLRQTVRQVLDSHPGYRAAQATVDREKARLSGAGFPIYNPELEAEMESAGEDTYAVGIAQSIDWHDKQSARRAIQQIALQLAKTEKRQLAMILAADTLNALAHYFSASAISRLHQERIELLEQVVALAEQRLAAGDINKSELLLARLSLGNAAIKYANQKINVVEAKNAFYKLSQQAIEENAAFDIPLPKKLDTGEDPQVIASQHPREKIALLRVEQAKRTVQSRQRERRPDPRLGVNVGREGEESLVGLRFSVDWRIRNDLEYTVEAAQKARLQAELEAQNRHRQIVADIQAAKSNYTIAIDAWKVWLSEGENQLKEHVGLLRKLWRSGEISTSDYLLQLEQNIHTQIAGADLQSDVWRAWIQWLSATGQVLDWLTLENEFGIKGEQQ